MKTTNIQRLLKSNMVFAWLAVAVLLVLSIPLVAMQYTSEVDWRFPDFVIMGVLLYGMGTVLIFLGRSGARHKFLLVALVVAIALYVWAELAVGILTNIGS